MTVYGGPRPTPPPVKPDWLLLAAFSFLVVAVIVGVVLGVQAFGSDGERRPSRAEQVTEAPAQPEPNQPSPTTAAPTTPSPTPAQTVIAIRPSMFRAGHSQLCMQTNEGNGGNATQVACDANPTQLWVPQPVQNTADTFVFVNAKDNRCLDVNGGSKDNGAQILQWDCHGGPNQQWRLVRNGDGRNFVSVNSGRCIGVDSGNPAPGAAVRQWDCDNSANQRWQVIPT